MMKLANIKWKAILGLIAVWVAIYFGQSWIWGVIFIIWVIPEIRFGVANFIEDVERRKNPVIYWSIVVSWILMSLLLILPAISPKMNPESHLFFAYKSSPAAVSKPSDNNTTTDSLQSYTIRRVVQLGDKVSIMKSSHTKNKLVEDTLHYKTFKSEAFMVVGINMTSTFKDGMISEDLRKLWDYYNTNSIYRYINKKSDERIYMVYHDYDKKYKDYFDVTLGFRVSDTLNVFKGLRAISVPKTDFSVIRIPSGNENAVAEMWNSVMNSDIERARTFDIEVYTLNENYDVDYTELWISTK